MQKRFMFFLLAAIMVLIAASAPIVQVGNKARGQPTIQELYKCLAIYRVIRKGGPRLLERVLLQGAQNPILMAILLLGPNWRTVDAKLPYFSFCIDFSEEKQQLDPGRLPELMQLMDKHFSVTQGTISSMVSMVKDADTAQLALVDKLNARCEKTVDKITSVFKVVSP